MSSGQFNFKRQYQRLGELLRPIDLENALVFCNHVVTAMRGDICHPAIRDFVAQRHPLVTPFLVHLAARQILLHSLGAGTRAMGTQDFGQLCDLLWEALDHDRAMEDPEWSRSDPTGWIIRYVALQQRTLAIPLQAYGLAVALFTDEMPRRPDELEDIPAVIERRLQMPARVFMRAGFVAGALRVAQSGSVNLAGTIATEVIKTKSHECGEGVAEHWERFLKLTSITPSAFQKEARDQRSRAAGYTHDLYRFNLLRRYPLIDVGLERYVTADPDLVIARTSLGIYYDGLEAGGVEFTGPFGFRFANLIGELIRSVCGAAQVWSESDLPALARKMPPSKNADHVILGDEANVLIECKALQPSTKLLMMGDPSDVNDLVKRVAGAVRQLTQHAQAIGAGKWMTYGLKPHRYFGVLVTCGSIPTVNGQLFRDKVERLLASSGCTPIPYLTLSMCEFDSLLRLVELGNAPAAVMAMLTADGNARVPGVYGSLLKENAITSTTRRRAMEFLGTLPGQMSQASE